MSRQVTPADRTRHVGQVPVRFDDLEVIACVYGPQSSTADVERMQSLGPGWSRAIAHWRASGTAYLLLVARTFDGGSLAQPVAIHADDRATIEQAVWAAMAPSDSRLCLLESFEPELVPFVRTLIGAARQAPGHG